MKSIMISIKPKWCALEMNGVKSIEVRRNKALANAIQKLIDKYGYADIYVYCSKGKYEMGKFNSDKKYHEIRDDCSYAGGWLRGLPDETVNGKVVFKFRCYKVEEIEFHNKEIQKKSCLTENELFEYLFIDTPYNEDMKTGYAIHISDLEIFDRPKELSEFKRLVKGDKLDHSIDAINYFGGLPLTKAPQNFRYVEVE